MKNRGGMGELMGGIRIGDLDLKIHTVMRDFPADVLFKLLPAKNPHKGGGAKMAV